MRRSVSGLAAFRKSPGVESLPEQCPPPNGGPLPTNGIPGGSATHGHGHIHHLGHHVLGRVTKHGPYHIGGVHLHAAAHLPALPSLPETGCMKVVASVSKPSVLAARSSAASIARNAFAPKAAAALIGAGLTTALYGSGYAGGGSNVGGEVRPGAGVAGIGRVQAPGGAGKPHNLHGPTAIPEPSSLAVFGVAVLCLLAVRGCEHTRA